jgi:transposase
MGSPDTPVGHCGRGLRLHAVPRLGFLLLGTRNLIDRKPACRMEGYGVGSLGSRTRSSKAWSSGVDEGVLVASVRPSKEKRSRCGQWSRRCPSYDGGSSRRRWRALDLGSVQVFGEADAPRVTCRDDGVVVASVRWARRDAGHTRAFDEQVAWRATKTSKTAFTELRRVAWRIVGSIIERLWDDTEGLFDRFADLTRIGIDEISRPVLPGRK